jgi:PAS domain S-box-containing protein
VFQNLQIPPRRHAYCTGDALTVSKRTSHDMRSPLGAITMSSELVCELSSNQDESLISLVKGIQSSADHALKILANLVGLLKATYDENEAWKEVNVGLTLDHALTSLDMDRSAAGAKVSLPTEWPIVICVQNWLSQIWTQLLSNSIRHGGKDIEIGWIAEGKGYQFWIRDNGNGLSMNQTRQPFPAFEALHQMPEIYGMGLPIVRRYLELLGSEPRYLRLTDGRTEFSFFLPNELYPRTPSHSSETSDKSEMSLIEPMDFEMEPTVPKFNTILALARKMLGAPVSMIFLAEEEDEWTGHHAGSQQTFDGNSSLLSDSAQWLPLCQRVIRNRCLVKEFGIHRNEPEAVLAFLGIPVCGPDNHPVACLFVADVVSRDWCVEDEITISDFAQLAQKELELRGKNCQLTVALQSIHDHESMNKILLNHSNDCINLIDTNGQLLSMNLLGCCLMEIDHFQYMVGMKWELLWPEESRDRVRHALEEALAGRTGRFSSFSPTGKGQPKWWDVLVTGVRNKVGMIVQLLSISHDITAEHQAQSQLFERDQNFRTLADHMSQLAWMADAKGNIFWYNQRWFDYTGSNLKEMSNWGWQKMHHPDHVSRVVEKIRECFEVGTPWEDTFPLRGEDGLYRWFLSRAVPIYNEEGALIQWFGTHTDITLQLETENAFRKASQAKDDFIAVLSHELRTPLGPVLLIASAAATRDDLPEDVRNDFNVIRKNVEMEARLIDDLLDMTRILRGKMPLMLTTVMLDDLLSEALAVIHNDASAKYIEVVTSLDSKDLVLQGDEVRLRQVFWNVLRNAVKFTPEKGVIHLTTLASQKAVKIIVRDSGVGMTESEIERMFDPFTQGKHAITEGAQNFGGLGLGLAISKLLVEQHGGSITAVSPGKTKGSTITIELPLYCAISSGIPRGSHGAENTRIDHIPKSLRILLVEDHQPTRETLALLLKQRGHYIIQAATIAAGKAAIKADRFDMLISDIGLPDGRGDDLMRELRAEGFAAPAIALSGYGMEADMIRSREAGFTIHLTKPVTIQELDRALDRVYIPM